VWACPNEFRVFGNVMEGVSLIGAGVEEGALAIEERGEGGVWNL